MTTSQRTTKATEAKTTKAAEAKANTKSSDKPDDADKAPQNVPHSDTAPDATPRAQGELVDGGVSQPVDPNPPLTVEGKDGIERIVTTPGDGWEPAPLDPDPAAVEAAKKREKAEKDAKEARLKAPEDRAKELQKEQEKARKQAEKEKDNG